LKFEVSQVPTYKLEIKKRETFSNNSHKNPK